MSRRDLTPLEANAIVRRHAHDLRNMINYMDLEIAAQLEDPSPEAPALTLQKIRDHLTLAERTVYSLSIRFREPSIHPAAAVDIFHNWRQQWQKLPRGSGIFWEEPHCNATISVDFTALIAVLVELCLQIKTPPDSTPAEASLRTRGAEVIFALTEPAAEYHSPLDSQQWEEWENLTVISGGRLESSPGGPSSPRVTSLIFPAA
jgi:hypothetical protein